ncbi:hypothetical protein BCR44DRAFT_1386889, partial [Catenaria anguillulae PL171]
IDTNFTQVDPSGTKFAASIAHSESVNHLVVLTLNPFPTGFGATVHINLPNDATWHLLGALTNDKPSAIFRLSGLRPPRAAGEDVAMDEGSIPALNASGPPAGIGISVEPLDVIQQQLATLPLSRQSALAASGSMLATPSAPSSSNPESTSIRMLQHLYNFVTSFATNQLPPGAHPSVAITNNSWIPVKTFEQWFASVKSKLPGILGTLSGSKIDCLTRLGVNVQV